MIIATIKRTYSKSINSKNYGLPESWVKVESTWEVQIESSDDPVAVSEQVAAQVQKEVIDQCQVIITKMTEGAAAMRNMAAGPGAAPIINEPRQM